MTGIKGNIFPTLLSAISQLVICNCQESVVCVILIDMQQPKSEPKISLLIRCWKRCRHNVFIDSATDAIRTFADSQLYTARISIRSTLIDNRSNIRREFQICR